jgi:hypothetical protein
MEAVTIPGWFIWAFGGFLSILLFWATWITTQVFKNDKDIALNTQNDQKVNDDIQKIYDLIDESKKDTRERFDKLEFKLDTFLNQEINFFKSLAASKS